MHPDPRELFLAQIAEVGEGGEFLTDDDGNVPLYDEGLLVRWDDVDVIKFAYIDAESGNDGSRD